MGLSLKDLAGPFVSAVGSFFGAKEQSKSAEKIAQENAEFQREFAQHGVRWRVEDALAAGVHPLYALGGSGATYSPNPIPVLESPLGGALKEMGQGLGRAVAAQETSDQRELRLAQIRLINAQAGAADAQAMAARAEVAKTIGQVGPAAPGPSASSDGVVSVNPVDPLGQYRGLDQVPLAWDKAKFEADPMTSRSSAYPGQTAGRGHASFREFEMPNGDLLYLPATQGGGIPEEIDVTLIPEIVGANIRRYGFSQTVLGALHRWIGEKYTEGMYTPGSAAWRERWKYRHTPKEYQIRR